MKIGKIKNSIFSTLLIWFIVLKEPITHTVNQNKELMFCPYIDMDLKCPAKRHCLGAPIVGGTMEKNAFLGLGSVPAVCVK